MNPESFSRNTRWRLNGANNFWAEPRAHRTKAKLHSDHEHKSKIKIQPFEVEKKIIKILNRHVHVLASTDMRFVLRGLISVAQKN